jgi:hypothetical protein
LPRGEKLHGSPYKYRILAFAYPLKINLNFKEDEK